MINNFKLLAITELGQLSKIVNQIRNKNLIYAIDLETTMTDGWKGKIVGISLCWSESGAVYVPIRHKYDQPFVSEEAIEIFRPLLTDYQFIAFNAHFELEFLEHDWKIVPKKQPIDSCLLTYVKGEYDFQSLKLVSASECPHVVVTSFKEFMIEEAGLSHTKQSIDEAPVASVADYSGRDVLAAYIIYKNLYTKYKDHPIYKLECAVFPAVTRMRRNGVLVDAEFFEEERLRLEEELLNVKKIIEGQVSDKAGEPIEFNIGSGQQLGEILYDVLKFPCERLTKKGARRTDKDTLGKLKWKSSIVQNIITYKEIQKRLSTYYRKYPSYAQKDGRIHASYNQTGVVTGRFSCSDPNLQNIPGKHSWTIQKENGGYEIVADARKGFVVSSDSWMVEFDYSQIEARIAAGVTREPVLINAFEEGIDYHTKTASLVFGIPVESVTKEQRFMGKRLNFALSYGMGTDKLYYVLMKDVDITYSQAKEFRRKYLEAYRTMFHEAGMISKMAQRMKSINTLWGRRVPVNLFFNTDEKSISEAKRMAYNARIQGSAADLLKVALVKTDRYIMENYDKDDIKMILSTHDSISFEVKKTVKLEQFIVDVLKLMEYQQEGFPLFFAEYAVGRSWGELEEPKKGQSVHDFVHDYLHAKFKVRQMEGSDQAEEEANFHTFVLELEEGVGTSAGKLNQLRDLIKQHPGEHSFVLKIGDAERIIAKTCLDLHDRERVQFILGGKFYERI